VSDDAPTPLRVLSLPVGPQAPDSIAEEALALLRTLIDMIEAGDRRDVIVLSCSPDRTEWTIATVSDLRYFETVGALAQLQHDLLTSSQSD